MKFFIQRRPDDTATLMTESGQVIRTFSSMQEAVRGCAQWVGDNDETPASTRINSGDCFNHAAWAPQITRTPSDSCASRPGRQRPGAGACTAVNRTRRVDSRSRHPPCHIFTGVPMNGVTAPSGVMPFVPLITLHGRDSIFAC